MIQYNNVAEINTIRNIKNCLDRSSLGKSEKDKHKAVTKEDMLAKKNTMKLKPNISSIIMKKEALIIQKSKI